MPCFALYVALAKRSREMSVHNISNASRSRILCFLLIVLCALIGASTTSAQTVNCAGVTAWAPNIPVTVGELVTFNNQEFKTLQAHTTLASWEPPNVPALFSLVGTCSTTVATPTPTAKPTATPTATPTPTPTAKPTATPTPTAKPTATPTPTAKPTATPTPTTKPTATPTPTPTPTGGGSCSGIAAWTIGVSYAPGALVTYNGSEYKCLQSNTAQTGWEPPN